MTDEKQYCTAEAVIKFTGIKPKTFGFEKEDNTSLETMINTWIVQATDMIDRYTHTSQDLENIPPTIVNVCMRLTRNMVVAAIATKNSPLIKPNDWTIRTVPSTVFSDDLKDDLAPFTKEEVRRDKAHISFGVVTGGKIT